MARVKKVEDTPMNMVWVVSEHMPKWFGFKIDSEVLAVTSDYEVAESIRAARKFSSDSKSFHTIDAHAVVEPPKSIKKPRAKRTKA